MEVKVECKDACGSVDIIRSKSVAHRLLICAALADEISDIVCPASSADIDATARCLGTLGAEVSKHRGIFNILPIKEREFCELNCGESGSTLRFLIPLAASLSGTVVFNGRGRLPTRPCMPLVECLQKRGARIAYSGTLPMTTCGGLTPGRFDIPGDVSSQFISGLIFALPLLDGNSEIHISGKIESLSYINITLDCVRKFGIKADFSDNVIKIPGNQKYITPGLMQVEGDWSNAAFWLCLGALSPSGITVRGLDPNSIQGDRAIIDVLKRFGANVTFSNGEYTVSRNALRAIELDASDIPDLVPIISVLAAVSEGETVIYNASRLRIKESDRIESTVDMLRALGADAEAQDDGIRIIGKERLSGGIVSSYNDHRIAMSAACAAAVCDGPVEIQGAEAVEKSYGNFFEELEALGAKTNKEKGKGYVIF